MPVRYRNEAMVGSWHTVIESVLRPARPHLSRCLAERDAQRRAFADERTRSIRDCERRIEQSRASIFAANDGVVPAAMTALEREWRILSRPDRGVMDLWARIAPARWIDRKMWADVTAALRYDAAVALASDVDGVEAAHAAVAALRVSLSTWHTNLGARVRFCFFQHDTEHAALLAAPLEAALAVATSRQVHRAREVERAVHEAIAMRIPERPLLASDVAHAAFVDALLHAVELLRDNPVAPLRALWSAGYVLCRADAMGVTLGMR